MASNFNNENDPWEYNLDIDDSDLYLTHVLRSSSSARVEPSPYTPNPVTIIPGHADIVQLSSSTCVEPSSSTPNPVRIIPGHAGVVQRAKLLRENVFILDSDGALMSTQEYMQKVVEDVGEDDDFNSGAWFSATNYVITTGGTQVVAIVKSCSPNALGNLNVTMKNLSGTIPGTVHHKVIGEGGYAKDITVGAAMILANVSVFTPKPSEHYLNITMRNVIKVFLGNGLITGVNIKNSTINVSHLFYGDDVIITTDWNAKDMDNIIRVLHVFYLASGLKINIHKSNIYGIGVNKDEVLSMASNAGCIAGDIPFNYLGLPIGSNMKSIASWKTLVDRFHMRLSSWKANLLSIGGRLTLIKSVLGSLGIYYLSIFRAPESVLQDLERIRANFFWGGNKDKNKMAWVKWPIILNSFDKGGLNIGSLKAFNLALLQKWRWRLLSSPNALWVQVIKAYHGQEGGFDTNGCSFKGIWANIVGTSNFLAVN
ncbi:RNA-directed DNA polymerase, eukaryota, reverse transcriptase zinc-binding domain protein [Tanacetum coccineum]